MTVPAKATPSSAVALPETPMEILARAVASGAAPETLEKLLGLQERWERNQARKAYDNAIALAKAEIKPITKNRTVTFGAGRASYQHEDLAEIERSVVKPLSDNGLSYRFRTSADAKLITVTCIISHKDGYYEENSLPAPADTSGSKNAIQAIGSTVTYLQRYTLKAALGLSAAKDDDDGNAATNTRPRPPAPNVMHDPQTGEIPPSPADDAPEETAAAVPPPGDTGVTTPAAGGGAAGDEMPADLRSDMSVEDLGREAAKHGERVFRMFYFKRTGEEQARLNAIGDELREIINAADKAAQQGAP